MSAIQRQIVTVELHNILGTSPIIHRATISGDEVCPKNKMTTPQILLKGKQNMLPDALTKTSTCCFTQMYGGAQEKVTQ